MQVLPILLWYIVYFIVGSMMHTGHLQASFWRIFNSLRCCLFFLEALISSKLHLRQFCKSCQKFVNSQELLSAKICVFKQKQQTCSTLILTIPVVPSSTNSNGSERFSDSILSVRQLRFFISSSISSSSSKYPSLSPSSDGT